MTEILAFVAGGVAVVAYPPANAVAVKVRDWLYSLIRKVPDDSDSAGA